MSGMGVEGNPAPDPFGSFIYSYEAEAVSLKSGLKLKSFAIVLYAQPRLRRLKKEFYLDMGRFRMFDGVGQRLLTDAKQVIFHCGGKRTRRAVNLECHVRRNRRGCLPDQGREGAGELFAL